MGITIICPKCNYPNALDRTVCSGIHKRGTNKGNRCEFRGLKRSADKKFGIDIRIDGSRIREACRPDGSNYKTKEEAEERLEQLLEKYQSKEDVKSDRITIGQLFDWYLDLPAVKAKKAYTRTRFRSNNLRNILGSETKLAELTIRMMEKYVATRAKKDSPNRIGEKIAPKTIHEELNLLRAILNKALDHDVIKALPLKSRHYPKVNYDNVRERIFTSDEIKRMIEVAPLWMRRIIIMAQGTGMRQDEIVQLTWEKVDLENGWVKLKALDTKTKTSRKVRLLPHVIEMLREIPPCPRREKVFLSFTGKPIPYWTTYCHDTFHKVMKNAGVKGACFHDFRHDFITKAIRAGTDRKTVMVQVGHKTMSSLERYHLVEEKDLMKLTLEN